jgi:hypothetical protein
MSLSLSEFGFREPVAKRICADTQYGSGTGFRFSLFTASVLLAGMLPLRAQPGSAPPSQDPLMSLMLSQPRIDVDSPVVPVATFDPPVIRPGERANYRVVLNAMETSIEWPKNLPDSGKLGLTPGGHGQLMAVAGASMQPTTTFNYHARPKETGQFSVPAFTLMVYGKPVTVPAAQLEVTSNPPPSTLPPQHLVLDFPTTNVFVGQALRVRVLSPPQPGGLVQGLAQVQINGEGFIVDQATARARVDSVPRRAGPANTLAFVHEVTLTPIAAGKLTAFAQGYSVGSRNFPGIVASGPGIVPAGVSQYALLDSDPVEFDVRPLPHEGELPGFTGAVGSFTVDPPQLTTNSLRVGDPVKLTVKVHGDGNLVRLVAPAAPRSLEWQVFVVSSDTTHPQIIQAQGWTAFSYTLVPLSEKVSATPAIPFCCFDPVESRFVDCSIKAVPITVAPGAAPVDLPVLAQAEATAEPEEKEPVLSGLASSPGLAAASLVPFQRQVWFPLVQLAPAAAFAGLWGWDRRRRFFEAHPDALLRRRARRALRRERRVLQKAARSGNADGFASAAVSAIRIACSPHYPAEPRALVGADVLALLPEAQRSCGYGQVVRRFFDSTDALAFGGAHPDSTELLGLHDDLEKVLDELEARL